MNVDERVYLSSPNDPGRSLWVRDLYLTRESKQRVSTSKSQNNAVLAVAEPIVAITLLDEEIHERYLQVIDTSDRSVVTVIELLSPSNKVDRAAGLESFREKRNQVMRSPAHWVEIDLLRAGVSLTLDETIPDYEYLVHVSPVERRRKGLLWPIRLSQQLPIIGIPLRPKDGQTPLDLQEILDTAYDRAGFDLGIDYKKEPVPPLGKAWKGWADRWLREKGLRPPKKSAK